MGLFLDNWCQSWSAAAHWLGKMLPWAYLLALRSLLAKGFLVISWGFWVFPTGSGVALLEVPLSSGITLFPLLVGNLVGGFLPLVMWLTSSPLEEKMSAFPLGGIWGAWEFFDKVSRGSDSLREPDAQLLKGEFQIFHSQFLVVRILTLWRMVLLGNGGGFQEGARSVQAKGQAG